MTTTEKIKEVATHKWTVIATIVSLVSAGGITKIGIPVFDKIESHLIEIKNNDERVLIGLENNYDMQRQVYIINLVDLYLRWNPSMIDSLLMQIEKDVFWKENKH